MSKRIIDTPKDKEYKYNKKYSSFSNKIAQHLTDLGYEVELVPAESGDVAEYIIGTQHPARFGVYIRTQKSISRIHVFVQAFHKQLFNDINFYKLLMETSRELGGLSISPQLFKESGDEYVELAYTMPFQIYEKQAFNYLLDCLEADVKYASDKVYEYQIKFIEQQDKQRKQTTKNSKKEARK